MSLAGLPFGSGDRVHADQVAFQVVQFSDRGGAVPLLGVFGGTLHGTPDLGLRDGRELIPGHAATSHRRPPLSP